MPLINHFDPRPRVWPPPRGAASFADCVDYAERRDPIGNGVHVALGCVYFFCAGLSTACESIAFVVFVGYALLRLPNLWRGFAPLMAAPVMWALFAFFTWNALSGMWTDDRKTWLNILGAFRGVLLIPAVFPIRRAWRPLLAALIAGMTLQSAVQLLQQVGVVPTRPDRTDVRFAGFHGNPVHVALFESIAVLAALGWIRQTRALAARLALGTCAVLLLCGIAITAGRGPILGLALGLALFAILLARFHGLSWKRFAVVASILVVAVACIGALIVAAGGKGLRRQGSDLFSMSDPTSTTGQRILWWRASIDAALKHPILGVGAGGTRGVIEADPNVQEAIATHPKVPRELFVVAHPHSMYLQTACELGAVGLVCLAAIVLAAGLGAWRRAAESPINAALAAALVAWAVAAGFDALHMTGSVASLLGALLAFAAVASRDRHEPRSAAWA